jgi:hypothetical protein
MVFLVAQRFDEFASVTWARHTHTTHHTPHNTHHTTHTAFLLVHTHTHTCLEKLQAKRESVHTYSFVYGRHNVQAHRVKDMYMYVQTKDVYMYVQTGVRAC